MKANAHTRHDQGDMADLPGSIELAAGWLLRSRDVTADGGMASFHLVNGWSASYPETTGYIIPTLIRFGEKHNRPEALEAAVMAADFLLGIQKPSGGWQGGRVNENKPEIVFNTGQVIRGMIATHRLTGEAKYLDAARRAGDWLAGIQHPEGFWKTHALMNEARVYDTFVDAPLLELYSLTGDMKLRQAAIKNLDWVVNEKMHPNGWFDDCDNTVKRNARPILHTIAYTLDGLIDSGLVIGEKKYIEAATIGASVLRDRFLDRGILNGRYDSGWNGSEHFICTGGAQMAIAWLKLYRVNHEEGYFLAAESMTGLLRRIQHRRVKQGAGTLGAITGSFPLWGRYEPFAYPNWATKFYCDALMLLEEVGHEK